MDILFATQTYQGVEDEVLRNDLGQGTHSQTDFSPNIKVGRIPSDSLDLLYKGALYIFGHKTWSEF
jgi:hypothetical protein